MKMGRFFWKLFLGNAALLVLVTAAAVWFSVSELDRFHSDELTPYLRAQADTLRRLAETELQAAPAGDLAGVADRLAISGGGEMRVTVIAPDGTVLADSGSDPARMASHADRPEFRDALSIGQGQSTRFSKTLGLPMKYFAQRIGPAEGPMGVVRLAVPIRRMADRAAFLRMLMWPVGLVAFSAMALLAVGLAVLWRGRIRRLTRTAQNLARGDLSARMDDSGADEVSMLARSLNRMGERLSAQLHTIDHQREVLQTLLSRLNEGVVVARGDGRIILLNQEAARLLNVPERGWTQTAKAPPMMVEDCVPQHDLQRLLLAPICPPGGMALEPTESLEVRLELPGPAGSVCVLARASDLVLPDPSANGAEGVAADGQSLARLVVLTDITDLANAAKTRSDFVANASHELRTPLSAIRGAVQTLMTMDLERETAAASRFLQMIERHSSRLEAMVADLLELSRLESPGRRFLPAELRLQKVCEEVQGRWGEALAGKGLGWKLEMGLDCHTVRANAHLLHLVLDNLIENAIKFTDPGGTVTLSCRCDNQGLAITVADTGCGIPKADQERVFERFYQVSSSRSAEGPEKRGTGLGLSIVRHAVAAMGGAVRLESELHRGTQVTVLIPMTAEAAIPSS